MKMSGLTFYLFQVKVMNVSEEWDNYFLDHSETVVVNLQIYLHESTLVQALFRRQIRT